MGAAIGRHVVVGGIHGLGDMLVVMVVVGGRVVLLRPASPARTRNRTSSRGGPHIGTPLHLLPSRQMRAVVHHAGLGCVLLLR